MMMKEHYETRSLPNRRSRYRALLFALAIAISASVYSQESEPELPGVRAEFRVGVAELVTEDVGVERRFVASTLPLLMYERLRDIDERVLSVAEQRAYYQERLDIAIREAAAALRAAIDARDALLFESTTTNASLETSRSEVLEVRQQYENLREMEARFLRADSVSPESEAERPLVFLSIHEESALLPAPDASVFSNPALEPGTSPGPIPELHQIAVNNDLDLLVFGFAEERAGYVIVDLYAYHRFLMSVQPLSRTTRLAEELGADVESVADEVAGTLLGREWASLVVEADRSDAAILVNNELLGFGRGELRYVAPGSYELRVHARGFEPSVEQVELAPGRVETMQIDLLSTAGRMVRLQSSPSEADVYVDSVWVGQTPISYRFPAGNTVVRLKRDGYLESQFVVGSDTPELVSRALLRDDIDWTQELNDARDGLYKSLSYFVLSVPVTGVLWGGFLNVQGLLLGGASGGINESRQLELQQFGNTLYWSSLGSVLINAGLLVNVVINVIEYVRVGEGAHNQ